MQKIISVVIDVNKFDQKIFISGIFGKFLYKSLKNIPVETEQNAFLQHGKKVYVVCTNETLPLLKLSTSC